MPAGTGKTGDVSYGYGPTPDATTSSSPIVGIANASATGYWEVATDGAVLDFGNAGYYGSLPGTGITPNWPIVGMAPTPTDGGYWLVAVDGGVFTFGDAGYYGSVPGDTAGWTFGGPESVALVPTQDGGGYWVIDADGGVFSFGDAGFYGSLPGLGVSTNTAVSATNWTNGYCLLEATGVVYCFDSSGHGSVSICTSNHCNLTRMPAEAIAATGDGGGLWVVNSIGEVYTYGDALYEGGWTGVPNGPIDSIAGWGDTAYNFVGMDGGTYNFHFGYQGNALVTGELSPTRAEALAIEMLPRAGWGIRDQWTTGLLPLWTHESGWNWWICTGGGRYPNCPYETTAYGIPQANPGHRMCTSSTTPSEPPCPGTPTSWQKWAWTQMSWGFWYIKTRYTSPIGAWNYWQTPTHHNYVVTAL